ncbi:phosphatase domain-containing protein [Pararhodonellum marinum]|uniref:phosphatase domain-containing protein n=1 Tax=Pararhodonellum marinum TaxID=2755358 RepID=UPI00188EEFEB|nr:phosphatase domain-containing protein [Pararhodonellum marinum]
MNIFRWLTFPLRYAFSKFKRKIGKLDLVRMELFLAFGNDKEIFIKGRIIEAYKQSRPSSKKNALQNVLASIRRYAGSSIPDARVSLAYQGREEIMVSNLEGLFEKRWAIPAPPEGQADFAMLTLLEDEGITAEEKTKRVEISRISAQHPIGIISDIDDTIIISHATSLGKKLWLSVSKNAYTRRPFPGVSDFYTLLTKQGHYPVFYVSSSDWNLFDLIQDFLNYRKIPKGPLLLKDPHVNLRNIWKSGGGNHDHKLEKISLLMSMFSPMKFILIGDSGQHDPELYTEIIEKYPDRVKAVYIRRIKKVDKEREILLNQYNPEIPIAWVQHSSEAIAHAKNFL